MSRCACSAGFNPRPREEGDTTARSGRWRLVRFNPRPREEGDRRAVPQRHLQEVSIHALAKRATRHDFRAAPVVEVSIHALAKRATLSPVRCHWPAWFQSTPSRRGRLDAYRLLWAYYQFQSTPSRRGRRFVARESQLATLVSIHALAKRATRGRRGCDVAGGFQSTPSRRGRPMRSCSTFRPRAFQSTPSRRGRHQRCKSIPFPGLDPQFREARKSQGSSCRFDKNSLSFGESHQ